MTKSLFGERLRTQMAERGLSAKETARRASQYLPGETFSPAQVARYQQGRASPRPRHIAALSLALGVDLAELDGEAAELSTTTNDGTGNATPSRGSVVQVEGDGDLARVHLQLEVPWDVALAILRLARGGA